MSHPNRLQSKLQLELRNLSDKKNLATISVIYVYMHLLNLVALFLLALKAWY